MPHNVAPVGLYDLSKRTETPVLGVEVPMALVDRHRRCILTRKAWRLHGRLEIWVVPLSEAGSCPALSRNVR